MIPNYFRKLLLRIIIDILIKIHSGFSHIMEPKKYSICGIFKDLATLLHQQNTSYFETNLTSKVWINAK